MKTTKKTLANQMIYCAFPRNHTAEGNLKGIEQDLDRIKALGTDILWLMPIHPIGKESRKGKDGSPYAIADFDAVNPAFGTEEDLKQLVDAAHEKGMKVFMDVVFNHTSPDSILAKSHPDWFWQKDGKPAGIFEEWSDIVDLDYSNPDLRKKQIETLKHWAGIVDGFRCDVASRVPVDFWKEAEGEIEKVHPDFIWLAESCHLPFVKLMRDRNRPAASDSQLYETFDVLYDYDIFPKYEAYIRDKGTLEDWVTAMEEQEARFPENWIKLRYLENHDTDRFAKYIKDGKECENHMAMLFMLKGLPMIYEGQEDGLAHRPSIFEQDVIPFKKDKEKAEFIKTLKDIHAKLDQAGPIDFRVDGDTLEVTRNEATGLFQLKGKPGKVKTTIKDGTYENAVNGKPVEIVNGEVDAESLPLIVWTR